MKPFVVFILGGPGSGKGTQSALIQQKYKFAHLSAGDLLREERQNKQSKNGKLIEDYIVNGKIVPSEITVALLQQAMRRLGFQNGKFLIDGFPRNQQNLSNWNAMMGQKVNTPFIIHLKCSQKVMTQRILKRSQSSGRSDDNMESVLKRFRVYNEQTKPVVDYFAKLNKLVEVSAENTVETVFNQLSKSFDNLI